MLLIKFSFCFPPSVTIVAYFIMDKVIRIKAAYNLQEEIESDPHRFRVVACGRRWGKTFMAMREAFEMLVRRYSKSGRRQRGWIVAPTFPLVREDWLTAETLLSDAITNKKQTEMKMSFGGIGFLEFKSAERDDEGLRGAGLDCCVIDEASRVSKKSWEYGIRPSLADKMGRAIFISTPKGRNWFYDMFLKGQEENDEVKSWQHPTYTNPYFPQEEWVKLAENTPDMILRQEYMADFLEDEATVFKNVNTCLRGTLEEPVVGETYTVGVDLGKAEDFTVITIIRNSTRQVVAIYRMRQIDWSLQKKQIIAMTEKYPSVSWIDSTGLGDPIEEDLRVSGVSTKDYKFTNASKQELVEQLVVAIEQGLIGIPDCPQTKFLIDELKSFAYEVLASGRLRYSAPEGLHDDGVISLGLAVRGIAHLLHNKPKVKEKKHKWGTADDWDKFYGEIDHLQRKNPFLTRNQAFERFRTNTINQTIARG